MNKPGSVPVHQMMPVRPLLSHMARDRSGVPQKAGLMRRAAAVCFALLALLPLSNGLSRAEALAAELFVPLAPDRRSADQTGRLEQIRNRPTTKSVTLVQLNIAALAEGGATISLPNNKRLNYSKKGVETRNSANFTWFGKLADNNGNATLVIRDGNITGTIKENGGFYRIEPLGNGIHAVIEVDESRFPPDHPPTFKNKERQGSAAPPSTTHDTRPIATPAPLSIKELQDSTAPAAATPVGIDVLVAYTPASRKAVPSIEDLIQLAVDEANESYLNSGVNIKLKPVAVFELSYIEAGKDYETILNDFAANGEVNRRRDTSGADLAVMIIDQTAYCGLAKTIMAEASNAFAVVYYNCAAGNYSFAHELGHLQGARHDPDNDPAPTPFPDGHGFRQPAAGWRTIMAPTWGGLSRVQYWSNPEITYGNHAMGTTDKSNNARVLNSTAGTVAGFRTPQPPASPSSLKVIP